MDISVKLQLVTARFSQNINESEHIKVFKGNNEVTSGTILEQACKLKS